MAREGKEGYHTLMPEKTNGGTIAYSCECGKKWAFPKTEANAERKCPCGRTIVVRRGFIFGTRQ